MKRIIVGTIVVMGAFLGAGVANAGPESIEPFQPLPKGLYHTGNDGAALGVYAKDANTAKADFYKYEAHIWEGNPRVVN